MPPSLEGWPIFAPPARRAFHSTRKSFRFLPVIFVAPVTKSLEGAAPRLVRPMYARVFSSMTSFTKCLQRSFTLRRKRSERLGAQGDGLEDDGCTSTAGGVRGGGKS